MHQLVVTFVPLGTWLCCNPLLAFPGLLEPLSTSSVLTSITVYSRQAAEAEAEAADRRAAAATAAAARAAAARAAEVEAQASRVAAERDAVLLSEQQGRLALMGQVSALQMGVAELQAANRRLREQVGSAVRFRWSAILHAGLGERGRCTCGSGRRWIWCLDGRVLM